MDDSSSPVRAGLAPGVLVALGLAAWIAGRAPIAGADLLGQLLWTSAWLVALESFFEALAATGPGRGPRQEEGAGGRAGLVFVLAAVALAPLTVVAETWTQLGVNLLLYHHGQADPTFVGWLRGMIDTAPYAVAVGMSDDPLSWFSRRVLGLDDERHPFATVACAPMLGDVLWAGVAMRIGTGTLRRAQPAVARAFRLASLQAATAPIALLGYFVLAGGTGLGVWPGIFTALLGTLDAGGQVPAWIRIVGTAIFFLLPIGMVCWRLCAERHTVTPLAAVRPQTASPRPGGVELAVAALVVPLLGVWAWTLTPGAWSWTGQTAWLALWLGYLAWAFDAAVARATGPRAGTPGTRAARLPALILLAWPLAVAALTIQLGAQWLVAALIDGRQQLAIETYGWFLGQVRAGRAGTLPPAAMAAAFAGNLAWAAVLLALARRGARAGHARTARVLRLGALQAATIPLALVAHLVLGVVTRDRAEPGMPRFDAWHVWTHVTRAALGASFAAERVPAWLSALAGAGFLGMPAWVARRAFLAEDAERRARSSPPADAGQPTAAPAAPLARRRLA
ncbi:MAG: hypothetical protein KIT14_17410 [bacterium]|nr:hypothetical protein [bacterium]